MGSEWTSSLSLFLMAMGVVLSSMFYYHLSTRDPRGMMGSYYDDNYKPAVYTKEPGVYEFAMVSDLDKASRDGEDFKWRSFVLRGSVKQLTSGKYEIYFDTTSDDTKFELQSLLSRKNRSMELSTLSNWRGTFYATCDFTGVVYEIDMKEHKAYPRHVLYSGNGKTKIPLKAEWSTVGPDDRLYIGSIGKEWVAHGEVLNRHCEWVKVIDRRSYNEMSVNWGEVYQKLRLAVNASQPGYLIHESVYYDKFLKQWIFVPRRHSVDTKYEEKADESLGTNLLIRMDERLSHVTGVTRIGKKDNQSGEFYDHFLDTRFGFTDIVRLTKTGGAHHYLGIRVIEMSDPEIVETYLTIFDENGVILLDSPTGVYKIPDNLAAGEKYEGIDLFD